MAALLIHGTVIRWAFQEANVLTKHRLGRVLHVYTSLSLILGMKKAALCVLFVWVSPIHRLFPFRYDLCGTWFAVLSRL
jgi:hypothetical protein